MALADIRQRPGVLLGAAILMHVVLISAQLNTASGLPMLQVVTFGSFAEVQRATMALADGVRNFWSGYIALQQGKVTRAVDLLEKEAGSLGTLTTIGEITIGCALGYLDFRFANEPWRPGHPKLEAWYAKVVKLPPLAETMPVA